MPVLWKALLGMLLTLPAGAYVAGTIVGPYDTATPPHQASPAASGSPTRTPSGSGAAPAYVGPTEAPAEPTESAGTSGLGVEPGTTAADEGGPSRHSGRGFGPEGPSKLSASESEAPSATTSPSETSSETPTPSESTPTDGTTSDAPSDTPSQSSGESTESPSSPSTDATAG